MAQPIQVPADQYPVSADELWVLSTLFELDWSDVQTTTIFETDVKKAPDGSEHRRALHSIPLTSISCDLQAWGQKEAFSLRSLLKRISVAGCIFPLMSDPMCLESAVLAGNNSFVFESLEGIRGLRPGNLLVLTIPQSDAPNRLTFEVFEIDTVDLNTATITTIENSTIDFPLGSTAFPGMVCGVSQGASLDYSTETVLTARVSLTEKPSPRLVGSFEEYFDDLEIFYDGRDKGTVLFQNGVGGSILASANIEDSQFLYGVRIRLAEDTRITRLEVWVNNTGTRSFDVTAEVFGSSPLPGFPPIELPSGRGVSSEVRIEPSSGSQWVEIPFWDLLLPAGDYLLVARFAGGTDLPGASGLEMPCFGGFPTMATIVVNDSGPSPLYNTDITDCGFGARVITIGRGHAIIPDAHNWISAIGSDVSSDLNLFRSGIDQIATAYGAPQESQRLEIVSKTRSEAQGLISVFGYSKGRAFSVLKREYAEEISFNTYFAQDDVLEIQKDTLLIDIEFRQYVYLIVDDITYIRRILSLTDLGATVLLFFDGFVPDLATGNISCVRFASLCRFDSDSMEQSWLTFPVLGSQYQLLSIPDEKESEPLSIPLRSSQVPSGWGVPALDECNGLLLRVYPLSELSGNSFADSINPYQPDRNISATKASAAFDHSQESPAGIGPGVRFINTGPSIPGDTDLSTGVLPLPNETGWTAAWWQKDLPSVVAPTQLASFAFNGAFFPTTITLVLSPPNNLSLQINGSPWLSSDFFPTEEWQHLTIVGRINAADGVDGSGVLEVFVDGSKIGSSFCPAPDRIFFSGKVGWGTTMEVNVGPWGMSLAQIALWSKDLPIEAVQDLVAFVQRTTTQGTVRTTTLPSDRELVGEGRIFRRQ